MTVSELLQHHGLSENPFKGEEARSDEVFTRLHRAGDLSTHHPDFEKIRGDLRRPSGAVVFGEKGSGKTAIRIQLAEGIAAFNAANPGARVCFVAYDDLNAVLDRLHERLGGKNPLESFQKIRLVDHLDALLHQVVPRLVDSVLGDGPEETRIDLGDVKRPHKRLDLVTRRDLLLLQTLYDRPEFAIQRTSRLRHRLRLMPPGSAIWGRFAMVVVPLLLVGFWWWYSHYGWEQVPRRYYDYALAGLVALFAIFALKMGVWDRLALLRQAHRIRRQIRIVLRGDISFATSLRHLPSAYREAAHLPTTDADEARFAMFDRLRSVLRQFGWAGLVVVVDRVDEPTLIGGDPERMKAVIWPLMSNKFLQYEGVGVKMLLPMELRHALFRESSAFFQSARLDKQCLIERLAWTGPTLYDLCEQRLEACRRPDAPPVHLLDLFAADVSRAELFESLEKLHQPRDAFKMLYRCILEHCQSVTRDAPEWKIPRHVLVNVVKTESERVQQMQRGIRPA
ncbi:MAG: hypothetical protein IT433_10885 [Phycisphaerales bacterium]|nr:hypothetical protein [Phycisphaerales bacterium]